MTAEYTSEGQPTVALASFSAGMINSVLDECGFAARVIAFAVCSPEEPNKAVFRVDIEDRGEAKGPSQLPDRYRIRLWLLDPSCGRNSDPDSKEAMELRFAASADPDKIANPATTEDLKVNIPPDIDDGGNMTQGNHQIHPETGAYCGESTSGVPALKMERQAGGVVVMSWPAAHSSYVLQYSTIGIPNWFNVTAVPAITKNKCVVTNTMTGDMRMFRLIKR